MTSLRRSSLFFLSSLMFSVPLAAAEINHAEEYARCMALAPSNPDAAFEMAITWKGLGGGDAAEHCASVSLLYAGQKEFAARRLEILAQNIVAEPEFKGQILAQAGQAWLLQGNAARAEAALSEAIKLLRGRPEVLIDRSQARAAMGDYRGAVEDLTNAISADPKRAEAYVFRGSAYRYLEELGKAQADISVALKLAPEDPSALLERGILFRLSGDNKSARADWLKVLEFDPEGEVGRLAQKNIEKMDVKVD